MVVLGHNAFIFESTGCACNACLFSDELGLASHVPIVDGVIAYGCPLTMESKILLVCNALHIPSMERNIIPLFIMDAGGLVVNDTFKIHGADPTPDDHCIIFPGTDFCIHLQLSGIFSYFKYHLPFADELYHYDK